MFALDENKKNLGLSSKSRTALALKFFGRKLDEKEKEACEDQPRRSLHR
jgi:hypothetical protein